MTKAPADRTDGTDGGRALRMPAEWEPHEAVWLAWPAEAMRSLAGLHAKLESTWLEMTGALQPHVTVRIVCTDEAARDRLDAQLPACGIERKNVELFVAPLDDVWMRDIGPVFVRDRDDGLRAVDWCFNGWGERNPYGRDRRVAHEVAVAAGVSPVRAPIVAEGGAFEVDGRGRLIATKSSLANANRNPGRGIEEIEQALRTMLGVDRVLWLSGAPPEVCEALGDCTDWHVDLAARFTPEGAILFAAPGAVDDPRHPYLERHRAELEEQAEGTPLVPLPSPEIITVHPVELSSGEIAPPGLLLDASYTNYLVTNGVVLAPMYGHAADRRARSILEEHFPGREIIGIPALAMSEEGGAIHCVTQQQPAAARGG